MINLEAEVDDSNGPVPMDVGAMKGSVTKGVKGMKGCGKGKYGKNSGKGFAKGEYGKSHEYRNSYEKGKGKGKKGKTKDRARRRDLHPILISQVIAGRVANGDTERTSAGKVMFREWRKLRVRPRVRQCGAQWSLRRRLRRRQLSFKRLMRMSRYGSLVWSADQGQQQRQTEKKFGTSWFWTEDRCQRLVRTHGVRTYA